MWRISIQVGMLGFLMVALPVLGAEGKNAGARGGKAKNANAQETSQVVQAGNLTGKLVKVDNKSRIISVQIEYQYLEGGGNAGRNNAQAAQQAAQNMMRAQQEMMRQRMEAIRQQEEFLREQQRLMQIQDPVRRQQEMQRVMARLYQQRFQQHHSSQFNNSFRPGQVPQQNFPKVVNAQKQFDFHVIDEVQVRIPKPPPDFDEKGNVRRYTDKELKELKGPNLALPGYTGNFDGLKIGSTVKVHFKRKVQPKNADAEVAADESPSDVTMIVVVVDEGTPWVQDKLFGGKDDVFNKKKK